jgi:hypothetical protein
MEVETSGDGERLVAGKGVRTGVGESVCVVCNSSRVMGVGPGAGSTRGLLGVPVFVTLVGFLDSSGRSFEPAGEAKGERSGEGTPLVVLGVDGLEGSKITCVTEGESGL